MEHSDMLFALLRVGIAGSTIWVLLTLLWRDYSVERYRDGLFKLRDEVFYLAMDGEIEFDSPEYRRLRWMINGSLRFAHTVSLLSLVMWAFTLAVGGINSSQLRAVAEPAPSTLPDSVRAKLAEIKFRHDMLLWEQIGRRSPFAKLMQYGLIRALAVSRRLSALKDASTAAFAERSVSEGERLYRSGDHVAA